MNRGRALAQLSALLRGRMPRRPHWREVLTLANEALVSADLCSCIEDAEAPEDVRGFLRAVQLCNRERNTSLMQTLSEACAVLNAAGVEPALLKGSALHALLGERAADRMMSDIDLLVRPTEFDRALGALDGAGFGITEDKRHLERHPVVTLARPQDAGGIDLHQRAPGGVVAADLWERCAPTVFAGARVRVPPAELQVLISIWHDQWHEGLFWRGGFHLRHLLDIALLANGPVSVDWDEVTRLSAPGAQRLAVSAQLRAAQRIAGARVPKALTRGLWSALAFARQRLQFEHPAINAPFRALGLTRLMWRPLSQRIARARP